MLAYDASPHSGRDDLDIFKNIEFILLFFWVATDICMQAFEKAAAF